MLSRNREQFSDSQAVKFVDQHLLLLTVNLVDGQEKRLAASKQQASQIEIGRRKLTASVHDQHDGVSLLQSDFGLTKDFRRDQLFFIRLDAPRVDNAKAMPAKMRFTVKTVAGDTGFVSHNGPPRAHDAVEQRGLANIWTAHDGDRRNPGRGRGTHRTGIDSGHELPQRYMRTVVLAVRPGRRPGDASAGQPGADVPQCSEWVRQLL